MYSWQSVHLCYNNELNYIGLICIQPGWRPNVSIKYLFVTNDMDEKLQITLLFCGPWFWINVYFLAATKQLYEWFSPSVPPSVCPSHFLPPPWRRLCFQHCPLLCYLPKFSILASMFVWRFVTCQNFQFWQVCSSDGLSVCLFVCLSGWTLLARCRSHRWTNYHQFWPKCVSWSSLLIFKLERWTTLKMWRIGLAIWMLCWFQNLLNHYSCRHYVTSYHNFGNFGKYAISDCFFMCLSVCLSVSNITEKRLNGFSWNFQGRWKLIQGTIGNIFRVFHLTPWTQDFFPTFSEQSMPLSSIAEKRLNGFWWNFQNSTDMTQGAMWNIFRMLCLTSWILGWFIYFLDPCLFVILWKNGWTDFHGFFLWNVGHNTRNH